MNVKIRHGIVFWKDDTWYTIFDDIIWQSWGKQNIDCYWMVLE